MKKTFNFIVDDDADAVKHIKSIDWNRVFNKVYETDELFFDGKFAFSVIGEKNISWFSKTGLWFAPLMFFLRYVLEMSRGMSRVLFWISVYFMSAVVVEFYLIFNSSWMNGLLRVGLKKKAGYTKKVKFLSYFKFCLLKSKYDVGGNHGSERSL